MGEVEPMIVLPNLGLGQLFVFTVMCSVAAVPAVVYVGLCEVLCVVLGCSG
jgi:hypothetical protein